MLETFKENKPWRDATSNKNAPTNGRGVCSIKLLVPLRENDAIERRAVGRVPISVETCSVRKCEPRRRHRQKLCPEFTARKIPGVNIHVEQGRS